MANYRYLGYGITDENGIAKLDHDADGQAITHSYTGTGAGEIDVVASLDDQSHISDSSILSGTYNLLDALFYIDGTTDTSNWQVDSGTTLAYQSDGTHMTGGTWAKLQISSNIHSFDGTKDLCFEFDMNTANQINLRYVNNSGSDNDAGYVNTFNEWVNVKLLYNHTDNTITPVINNVSGTAISTSNTATIGFAMVQWGNGFNLTLKNFKVYPI